MIAIYHQTKTPISFLCKEKLNPRSLTQSLETLPIELTETHKYLKVGFKFSISIGKFLDISPQPPDIEHG